MSRSRESMLVMAWFTAANSSSRYCFSNSWLLASFQECLVFSHSMLSSFVKDCNLFCAPVMGVFSRRSFRFGIFRRGQGRHFCILRQRLDGFGQRRDGQPEVMAQRVGEFFGLARERLNLMIKLTFPVLDDLLLGLGIANGTP